MTLDERIERYLDKCPPAVSGSGGHGQTFTVACALVNGFALDADAALRHLTTYNATCSPPWSPRELRHKVQQAEKTAHTRPRGHLLGTSGQRMPEAVQMAAKVVPVRLTPKKRQFGTVGTFLSDTTDYVRAHTQYLGSEKEASRASQPEKVGLGPIGPTSIGITIDPFADTSVQIHTDPGVSTKYTPLDWTALDAAFPPDVDAETWRKLESHPLGREPLVLAAFGLFGPGCTIIEEREGARV